MTNYGPTAADWLKFIRAQGNSTLEWVSDWIAGRDVADCEQLCDAIDSVRVLVAASPVDGDPHRYSDGRPVYSEIEIDPSWEPLRHVWHPDPSHQHNQAQEFTGDLCGPSGIRKRVVIAAPGVLDAVTVEPLRSVE